MFRICFLYVRLQQPIKHNIVVCKRSISAQQAQQALRPFYFAVHPDRFATDPKARSNNEKSLQIFNGYIHSLFPTPSNNYQKSIELSFAIHQKDGGSLKNVSINLSGNDPHSIIRAVLEKFNLSTEHLPKLKPPPSKVNINNKTGWRFNQEPSFKSEDDLWRNLHQVDIKKRSASKSAYNSNDLLVCLLKNREEAILKAKSFEKTSELLNDEIEFVIRKTGANQIIWRINWDQSYMRRCLMNIQNLISQADSDTKQTIINSLYNRNLILGRGSFVCCDGSLQFGADDATGAWQKVCLEANIRRFEIKNLERLINLVRVFLGNSQLILNPYANLIITTQQMNAIISRIGSRPFSEVKQIKQLSENLTIEIVNGHCELAMLQDGRLQIPFNVDIKSIIPFLSENRQQSQILSSKMLKQKIVLENLMDKCCRNLNLKSIDWDKSLRVELLIESLKRLCQIDESRKKVIEGLAINLSYNPHIFLMSDGRISIPINWT